jgi:lysozyme family protein
MSIFREKIAPHLLGKEGGYVNHPNDRGGETNWGITVATARANGYAGPMRSMTREQALDIYEKRYYLAPRFDVIALLSPAIGLEVTDAGVNMGPQVAVRFLQAALNGFNRQGKDYADITVDGSAGKDTRTALRAFLAKRGAEGERVLLKALNCLQGARYLELGELRPANEDFMYGWFANRIEL